MAYQSIYSSGATNRALGGKPNPFAGDFKPGQYAKVNADIAAQQPKTAPQVQPPNTNGQPTSKWARIAQVGIGKVNLFNAYRTVVEHKASMDANNSMLKSGAKTVGNVGKAVASDFVNIGKEANKNVIQPIIKPSKPSKASDIMQTQAAAQTAVKSGNISPDVVKIVGQIQGSQDKITAYKVLADTSLTNKQRNEKLMPIIQKQSAQTKKMLGAALEVSSLVVGGGETEALFTGAKTAAKVIAPNVISSIAGGTGSKLLNKPDVSSKELLKAVPGEVALGVGTTVAGAGAGKLFSGAKTALGKDKAVAETISRAKTSALLQKGKEANVAEALAPSKTKLLTAGEKQPVKGEGFTMSEKPSQTAISRGREITQLEERLTQFQQGKLKISPEQAKADAQRLAGLKSGKITAVEKLTNAANKTAATNTITRENFGTFESDARHLATEHVSAVDRGDFETAKSIENRVAEMPAKGSPKLVGKLQKYRESNVSVSRDTGVSLTEKLPNKPNITPADETFKNIKMASAKSDTKGFFRAIHEWFNPAPGKVGAQVQRDLRTSIGGLTQQKVQSEALARDTTRAFGKMSPQEHLQFIQNVGTGAKHATPQLEKLGATLKEFNKGNEQVAKSLNPDIHVIENYTTHSGILDVGNSKSFANAWSKAPFKGDTGALKERAFPTVGDMLQWANEKGIPVKETNPMTLAMNSRAGLLKAKMAQDFLETQTARGVDPAIVQKVIDRYLEPGLGHNQVYKTLRQAGNALNNLQLGLSGFHFTGTALNASFSEFANGINHLLTGHPLKAAGSTIRGAYAPIDYAVGGHGFIKDLVSGVDNHYTQAARIANFNPIKNNEYVATGLKKTLDNFKNKNILGIVGTPLTIIPRTVSTLAKPLMEHWVPDLKAGAFKRAVQVADEKLGPNATAEARQAAYQKVADSIDNRFGQLNKDNIFWNKTFKDMNNMAMRSPGWNIGTVRELGGGIKDVPGSLKSLAKGKGISERTAYTASLGVGTMLIGAILQKTFTGKGPTELIDYFYPKTGKVDKNGNEERVSLPTYSKDVFSFMHSPGSTITNKANPLLSVGVQGVKNKDYFGNQIRNPEDSFGKQAKQEAGFLGKNLLPFSLSNTTQRVEKTPSTKAQTIMGLNPAPGYITKSKLAQDIQKTLTQSKGSPSLTPEEQTVNKLKEAARGDLSRGRTDSTSLQQLKSQLSPNAYKAFIKTGGENQIQRQFDSLSTDQKLKMIEKYSPSQLRELDLSGVAKSLVGSSAKNVFDSLQTKGYSPERVQQDLQKVGIDKSQLIKIKAEAKRQAAIQARQSRNQPKFVNPLVK